MIAKSCHREEPLGSTPPGSQAHLPGQVNQNKFPSPHQFSYIPAGNSLLPGRVTVGDRLVHGDSVARVCYKCRKGSLRAAVFTVITKCLNNRARPTAMKLWSRGIYEEG